MLDILASSLCGTDLLLAGLDDGTALATLSSPMVIFRGRHGLSGKSINGEHDEARCRRHRQMSALGQKRTLNGYKLCGKITT